MLLGVDTVFNQVPTVVESLLGIGVNTTQVFRACQAASEQLDSQRLHQPSAQLANQLADPAALLYGMVDGSMLLTQQGWQETKVGRVFSASAYCDILSKALDWQLGPSEYVACRGHYAGFVAQFETLLPPASAAQKVFLSDGAVWIGQWLSASYPQAQHILDFFHVCEKLALVAQDAPDPLSWFAQQKEALLDTQLVAVLAAMDQLVGGDQVLRKQVMNYFQGHAHQMDYRHYRQQGWMISSGPIESAHRTVLQVRMKRSGQHWSPDGCDKMIQLRVAYRSGKTKLIGEIYQRKRKTAQH